MRTLLHETEAANSIFRSRSLSRLLAASLESNPNILEILEVDDLLHRMCNYGASDCIETFSGNDNRAISYK